MSQQIRVTLICDMAPPAVGVREPQQETDTSAVRTVTLGIDGRDYELEMCTKHELQLLQTMGRYTAAARRVPRPGIRRNKSRTWVDRQHSREVRAWAAANGHRLAERGRIPLAVLREHAAACAPAAPLASL